jgi:hypothetical protein
MKMKSDTKTVSRTGTRACIIVLASLMVVPVTMYADDVKDLHRLAEKVAKAEAAFNQAVIDFNKKARSWEANCRSEGKTPSLNAFTNPTCLFVPMPSPPPGTNK